MVSSSSISALVVTSVLLLISHRGVAQHLSGVVGMVNAGLTSAYHPVSPTETGVTDSIRFGNMYTLVGAEGYYRNGNAVIFLSGHLGVQEAQPNRDKFLEQFLWRAHAGFGWLLTSKSKFSIYPAVGLGVSELSLTEHSKHADSHVDIIKTTTPSADLSLHCDYLLLDPGPNETIVNGVALGVKIGYNFSIASVGQLQGWYFTICVGGLAFMRNNR